MTDLSSYRNTALTALHLFGLLGMRYVRVKILADALGLSVHHTRGLLRSLALDGAIDAPSILLHGGAWCVDVQGVGFCDNERGMNHLSIIREGGAI